MQEYALVILAAGLGSRFGGVKQLKKVGPSGEIIMEYAIHDAMEAGFNKIVFVIRKDIEADFMEAVGNRVEEVCTARGVAVTYAYQDLKALPAGFVCPADRRKPWGTGHALLTCSHLLHGPFVVINADDYYGKSAYKHLMAYLKNLPAQSAGQYCMAGFHLGNTLSDHGGVTRGICRTNEDLQLLEVRETRGVVKKNGKAAVPKDDGWEEVDGNACVSMNMWGFTADVLPVLEQRFVEFLRTELEVPNSEYLLPDVMDKLLAEGKAAIRVLPTGDNWYGITYQADAPLVEEVFRRMVDEGIYNERLFG